VANIQVVVQDQTDESAMFLIDDNGIIKSIEQINAHQSPMTSDHNIISGALPVQHESSRIGDQVASLLIEFERVTNKISALSSELDHIVDWTSSNVKCLWQ